mgnify:CR=1 FL=1
MMDFIRRWWHGTPHMIAWPNPHPVPNENVFIHLAQEHGLISSSSAKDEIVRRTHYEDHEQRGERGHNNPWNIKKPQ